MSAGQGAKGCRVLFIVNCFTTPLRGRIKLNSMIRPKQNSGLSGLSSKLHDCKIKHIIELIWLVSVYSKPAKKMAKGAHTEYSLGLGKEMSGPRGAWKCNFHSSQVHTEVTLPIKVGGQQANHIWFHIGILLLKKKVWGS